MNNTFSDWLDNIDHSVLLLLNNDSSIVPNRLWATISSHAIWVFPVVLFMVYIFRKQHWKDAIIIILLLSANKLSANTYDDCIHTESLSDTIKPNLSTFSKKLDRWSSTSLYSMTYIGVPLFVGGLIVKGEDNHFRRLRNDYLPKFNNHTDDYLQFVPAALILGLKAAGVEGRSSWQRMLTSDAFSAITMASVVNTLKQTIHVMRPDGSNKHSFPSGHTATAFMTATMLTKEYGYKSPWVGIGAYATATATGVMRMANNKHWLSDVLAGASIGILSTEIGYYLADLIFKEKGYYGSTVSPSFNKKERPSFLSLYVGLNVPLSKYDIDENTEFRTSSGSSIGLEGAYFHNPYIGIGGRFTISNTALIINRNYAEDNTLDALSLCTGFYFSYPLSQRWSIGSKLLGGFIHYPQLKLSNLNISARNGACFGSGISLAFKATEYYGIRFFLDYNLQPSHNKTSKEWMNTLACGVSFAVLL